MRLGTQPETDPEADVVVDVGLASTRYDQAVNSPESQAAQKEQQEDQKARTSRLREVLVLAGGIMMLFALERILGKSTKAPRSAASGSAITTAAKAVAGGA